jgi:Cu(I)/Ag(I) efflux system membrane fusion protein
MKRKPLVMWGLRALIVLVLLGSVGAVMAFNEEAKQKALSLWRETLVWAGFYPAEEGADSWFWCPMHPEIKRKKANDVCPICNMALVPLEGEPTTLDALVLTPQQVQQAAVVTLPVLRRQLYQEIDTTGRLDYDERVSQHISSWVKGKSRIIKQYVNFVGETVKKGDLLAEIYSPELIRAQEDLLLNLNNPISSSLVEFAKDNLQFQGMTEEQIAKLVKERKAWDAIPIQAPISGTVTKRQVVEGQYVSEGDPLYHLADLSSLWLFADVYEDESPLVHVGQSAEVSLRGRPGEKFDATVAFIDPMVQTDSRTVRVRFNIPNKEEKLKPGMYARVQLKSVVSEMVAVPENAVLWSGKRTVVLVKQGEGTFQPREVRLGQKWLYAEQKPASASPKGNLDFGSEHKRYHEVLAGLKPGEEVVTAGAFLLNAESQFQNILTKMLPPESDSATLEEVLGSELARDVHQLLDDYYGLSKTLVDDQLKPIAGKAKALADAADALAKRAAQAKIPELARDAEKVKSFANELATPGPKDLQEARYHFGRISKSTVQLLANNGGQTIFGKDVFLFRCGMSKVGYENWLWWSSEKLNPYMGQRMLTCGSQLKTLTP